MWNYRIIKHKSENGEDQYGLFEVMYNDDGEIFAHTEEAEVVGETSEDLLQTLRLMLDDAQKSYYNILEYGKIKFAKPCEDYGEAEVLTIDQFDKILKDLK